MSVFRGAATPLQAAYYGDQPLKRITYGDKVVWVAPVPVKDWATLGVTSTLPTAYNNATFPVYAGRLTIPGWTFSTSALPIRGRYYARLKPTYEFDVVTTTPTTNVHICQQPSTIASQAAATAPAEQVSLGGSRYRSDKPAETKVISITLDPANPVTLDYRTWGTVAASNLYFPAEASYAIYVPLIFDVVSDTDTTVTAAKQTMWNHRATETNSEAFDLSTGIKPLIDLTGLGTPLAVQVTYTLTCPVAVPSIIFGLMRGTNFVAGGNQTVAITTPAGDGTYKYDGVLTTTGVQLARNELTVPALNSTPAAPVTLKAGCRIQIVTP